MCKHIGQKDIVDELKTTKSRSKRLLLDRAANEIITLRRYLDHEKIVSGTAAKENRRILAVLKSVEAERDAAQEELAAEIERLKESRRVWVETAVAQQEELKEERYRHDRLQDFCVAQGLDLDAAKEALKKTLNSCDHCAHCTDNGDECEEDCECCEEECVCKGCANGEKWVWKGRPLIEPSQSAAATAPLEGESRSFAVAQDDRTEGEPRSFAVAQDCSVKQTCRWHDCSAAVGSFAAIRMRRAPCGYSVSSDSYADRGSSKECTGSFAVAQDDGTEGEPEKMGSGPLPGVFGHERTRPPLPDGTDLAKRGGEVGTRQRAGKRRHIPMKKRKIWFFVMLISFVALFGFAGALEQNMIGFGAGTAGLAGSLGGIWLFGKLSGVIW